MGLRSLVRRSIWLSTLYYIADDWRSGRRLAAGEFETTSGARHTDKPLSQSLDYIRMVHGDYLAYAETDKFSGSVAEIGPGDNFGVALLLLANGADQVHAIDRYYSRRDPEQQRRIYQALADAENADELFDGTPGEDTMRGLFYHPGVAAEEFFRNGSRRYDAILSRAVFEHLYDPISALSDMATALNPGGRLVHRIDLRDHGMFADHHPLTFLTVPAPVYRRMTRQSGRPNRVLLPRYRDWLTTSGLDGDIRITRLAGVDGEIAPSTWNEIDQDLREQALATVRQIRPKLCADLKRERDDDLAVSGIVLRARKPL